MTESYTGEYAQLRSDAESAMRDKCKIGTRGTPETVDPSDIAFTYGDEINCGLHVTTKGEATADGSQATITNALLRLPWGTNVETTDRIQITEQGGVSQSGIYYAVDGAPYQSLINVVVRLKRITGESNL